MRVFSRALPFHFPPVLSAALAEAAMAALKRAAEVLSATRVVDLKVHTLPVTPVPDGAFDLTDLVGHYVLTLVNGSGYVPTVHDMGRHEGAWRERHAQCVPSMHTAFLFPCVLSCSRPNTCVQPSANALSCCEGGERRAVSARAHSAPGRWGLP
jgi:hypothetical protein